MSKRVYIKLRIIAAVMVCGLIPCMTASGIMVIPEVNLKLKNTVATQDNEGVQATKISRNKIAASPAPILSDLLKQEQSIVRVTNNTNDNSQVVLSVRGFGDNAFANSLIVIDGFPLVNPSVLAPSFNAIALSDILRVKLIQGSEGSLWGDQAVGGVVKIDTLQPEKPQASAYVGYGSDHKTIYTMSISDRFDNGFFFKLQGFVNSSDNYRDHNQQIDQGISSQCGWDYATGSLTLNAKVYDDSLELPGGLTQQQYDNNPRQASNDRNSSHLHTQLYQLIHKQVLASDWSLETRLAHQQIQGDGFINAAYTRQDMLDTFNPLLAGTVFNSNVLLGYAGQVSGFQLENSVTQQKAAAQQSDLYTQVVVPLFKHVDFTWGGRLAWQNNMLTPAAGQPSIDMNNSALVSEQGLAYHPSANWEFFLRRDGNFRFPKANELTTLPDEVILLPQTGVSYEVGAKWRTLRHTLQLSAYQLRLNNEIAYDPTQTDSAPFGSYSNFPQTQRQGISVMELYRLTPQLTIDSQLNYVDARFAAGDYHYHSIPAVPAINGNIGWSYQFKPHWQAKYTAVYIGNRYPSQDVANAGPKLPGYWLSNVALQYFLKTIKLSFSLENLFNQRYPLYTVYSPASQMNTYYPGVGRSFLLTANVFLD